MFTLYFAPGTSSMAVHIALHEVGAAFESRRLSFAKREQHSFAYLALNPEGKVPTLLIDGRPLTKATMTVWSWAHASRDAGTFMSRRATSARPP